MIATRTDVRRDHLGYWHARVVASDDGQVLWRSRPAQRAVWFGHWTRRGALRAARSWERAYWTPTQEARP